MLKIVKNAPSIVQTNTGELYCPSRLIYRIKNKFAILKQLEKLSCFYKHPKDVRWFLECSEEAFKFSNWNQHYIRAAEIGDSIVIAYMKFPSKT